MQSGMKHDFARIPSAKIRRSSFDRSHTHKTTFDGGYLIPILVDEALPGDTFRCKLTAFARMATPLFPTMDNCRMDTHFFAVPVRLLWKNWEKFHGAQDNPGDSTDYLIPQINTGSLGHQDGGLFDYMGIPTQVKDQDHSVLPLRAFNKIYNEWFRDENLQDAAQEKTGDGPDTLSDYQMKRRGKFHDYFSSCLPFPQKGASVELPIGGLAPIIWGQNTILVDPLNSTSKPTFQEEGKSSVGRLNSDSSAGAMNFTAQAFPAAELEWVDPKLEVDLNDGIGVADLSQSTNATVNAFRQAQSLQQLLEKDARGGTRYTEMIQAHFGVSNPDHRMQRSEYLGGGTQTIDFHQVAQTDHTPVSGTPQGHMAAYAISAGSGHRWNKSFTEHCIIIGLMSVRCDLTYQQGLDRMWSRKDRYDHYLPVLANIGEQSVLNKEIYWQGTGDTPSDNDDVFGYQERWSEYRHKQNRLSGKFRSNAAGSLDVYHFSQDFLDLPILDDEFIVEDAPIQRTIATPNEPEFLVDMRFEYHCARPMPTYSVPGLTGHF